MLTEMKGIVMDFGPVRAVDHVDLTVGPGEILGLLGENGAGKTTLMNILAGTFLPTEGEIYIDGEKTAISTSLQAAKHGIRFIHQELSLCGDLTVVENMFLAQELTGGLFLDKKAMAGRAGKVFERMGVDIDPLATTDSLLPAEKQLIEIARSLLFKSSLIIMDEPTTALSNYEVEHLFTVMKQLKAEGQSFIYISHKMPELFEICDSYFVMRDGKFVAKGQFSEIDEGRLTELMIGRQLADGEFADKPNYATDEVVLSVEAISGKFFKDVSFELHNGEILAITGLQGSGRDLLADALFGVIEHSGDIRIDGRLLPHSGDAIKTHMKHGVAMVPRSRIERGIHNDLSISDNLSMGYFNTRLKSILIKPKTELERFERQRDALSIKAERPQNVITSLSGGNQQKVILGRWLETDARVILFDNPTQGIDVGAKFEIYRLIHRLAQSGKAVIIFSSEYQEIRKLADSCLVMYKGAVRARLWRGEITEKAIMYYSTGANLEGGKNE